MESEKNNCLFRELGKCKPIWTIEKQDDLKDTFRVPMPSTEFVVEGGVVKGYPSFHASQADPDGQYEKRKYTITFDLEEAEELIFILTYIASTPRIPQILLRVNGHIGTYLAYPTPSQDQTIWPSHALHAAIYNRENIAITIPSELLNNGENRLQIEAVDNGDVLRITNEQAVLRLDRMADACGFHYGAMALYKASDLPSGAAKTETVKIRPEVFYKNNKDGVLLEQCSMIIDSLHTYKKDMLKGTIEFTQGDWNYSVLYNVSINAFGQTVFLFDIPAVDGRVEYCVKGDCCASGNFYPRKKWNVYITPHAHTDIGYTHRQWEVAERMCRNLDTALDTLADSNGEDFSYVIDASWHVEEYSKTRSKKKIEQVAKWVKEKKIGVPWNYADLLTQLPTLEGLIHNGDFSVGLLRDFGLSPDRADIVDVASASWSYPTILSGCGVRYLIHANNQDRGPFRLNGRLHKKNPFWWRGPDGSGVLTWLANMYCELKKVCGSPASKEAAKKGLSMWLLEYEREDYVPDAVLLYGMEADNTDIDVRAADFVREWNDEYEYPKLIPSDGSSFFSYVSQFSDSFCSYQGDGGAYWEDGAASSVRESILVRQAESGLRNSEVLETLSVIYGTEAAFPYADYQEAWKQVLLYDEHTWGAFLTGSDPESLLAQDQWSIKKSMADQAFAWKERLLNRAASRLSLMWNNAGREIVIYNPNSFPVSAVVPVEIGVGESIMQYQDNSLELTEALWAITGQGVTQIQGELLCKNIEGMSYKRFPVVKKACSAADGGYEQHTDITEEAGYIENDFYRVKVDVKTGCITELYDITLKKQLNNNGTFGQMLYVSGGEGTTLLGNRSEYASPNLQTEPFFCTKTNPLRWEKRTTPYGSSITVWGESLCGAAKVTYRLADGIKELKIIYDCDKNETDNIEALYIDFPTACANDAEIWSDTQTGWVNWSKDVLPGACKDWLPLQNSIIVRDDNCDLQISSPDIFLFTVGSPVTGSWSSEKEVKGNHIYSYVLNNYWRVNYKAKQGGRFSFQYAITSRTERNFAEAYRFAVANRNGLYAQRMSYQEFRDNTPDVLSDVRGGTLLTVQSDKIAVSTMRGSEDGTGIILRLIEISGTGDKTEIIFNGKQIQQAYETDHHERIKYQISLEKHNSLMVAMEPFSVKTYKIIFCNSKDKQTRE